MARLVAPLTVIARLFPERGPFLIQHGVTPVPDGWSGVAVAELEAMQKAMGEAEVIIAHGGPATISEARAVGRIPVVVPRRRSYREHVDDHQYHYVERLTEAREVILVEDVRELPTVVENYGEIAAGLPAPSAHDPHTATAEFARLIEVIRQRS